MKILIKLIMNSKYYYDHFQLEREKNYSMNEKEDLESYLPYSIISDINNMDENDASKMNKQSSFYSKQTDSSSFYVV